MVKEFENLSVKEIGTRINTILSEGRNRLDVTTTLFSNYYPKGKKTFGNDGPCFVVSFSLTHLMPMDFDVYADRVFVPNPDKMKALCKKQFNAAVRDNRVLIAKLDDGSGGEYVDSLKKSVAAETASFKATSDFLESIFGKIRELLEGEGFMPLKGSRLDDTFEYKRAG